MYRDDFKARYTTIPFAIYREYCEFRNYTVISHQHKEMELISITEGRADFYIDTVHYEVKKGDVVIIPPYAIHRIRLSSKELVAYNCICFDLELIWDADIKNGLTNNTLFVEKIVNGNHSYAEKMQEWIAMGCHACENGRLGWELVAIGCMSMIIGSLKEHGYFTSELKNKRETRFAQKAMNYISDNYFSQITSTTAAISLYMNNSYFCRTFKKVFGCRFSEYVLAYRLEKAKIYLSNTNDPITDISFRIGFNNCSYFSKVFKEYFNVSPLSYRKAQSRRI